LRKFKIRNPNFETNSNSKTAIKTNSFLFLTLLYFVFGEFVSDFENRVSNLSSHRV